jgi:putative endonuclease
MPLNIPTPPASNFFAGRKSCPERARILGESKGRNSVHYCYILRCCDESYYVGVSEDPHRRLLEHNDGKGADWTVARLPVELAWTEQHPSLSSARKRENQLKRWTHKKKDALVRVPLRLRSGQGL